MAEVIQLHSQVPTLKDLIALAMEKHPEAVHGVIFLFDKDTNLDYFYNVTGQEMAMVGAAALRAAVDPDSDDDINVG